MTRRLTLDDPRVRTCTFEARAVVSWTGQVQDLDTRMLELLGRPADEVVGAPFVRFVQDEDRRTFRHALVQCDPGRRWRLRLRGPVADHDVLVMLARPSREHDELVLTVLAGDDAAHLRQLTDDLARTNASRQAVIDSLQAVLVPEPRPPPGLDVAIRHVAQDADTATSGDASDVLALDGGCCHVALVDVTGHGVAHITQALVLIQTLRLLALAGTALDDLFEAALPLLRAQDDELTACAVVGRYDVGTGSLRLLGAGAPPVAVCRTNGTQEIVTLPGAPLGFGVGPAPRPVEIGLDVDDRVVLITDGVLGHRSDDWPDQVRAACHDASGFDPDPLASLLLQRTVERGRHDDATIVALRRRDTEVVRPQPDARSFAFALDPTTADVPRARLAFRRWLGHHGLDREATDDAVLVMSELSTNAARVARASVDVAAHVEDDQVVIETRDDGPGLPPAVQARLRDVRGAPDRTRGLFLVAEIADDVFVASDATGTFIRAWCRRS